MQWGDWCVSKPMGQLQASWVSRLCSYYYCPLLLGIMLCTNNNTTWKMLCYLSKIYVCYSISWRMTLRRLSRLSGLVNDRTRLFMRQQYWFTQPAVAVVFDLKIDQADACSDTIMYAVSVPFWGMWLPWTVVFVPLKEVGTGITQN